MNEQMIKDLTYQVRNCLKKAELQDAIGLIVSFTEKNNIDKFSTEIIGISARVSQNRKLMISGTEDREKINREWNSITFVLSELLIDIERDLKESLVRQTLQNSYKEVVISNGFETNPDTSNPKNIEEWNRIRKKIYTNSRDIFLVHTLWPSDKPKQEFDIYIYLADHKPENGSINKVKYAEFFLGKSWNYKIFKIDNENNKIGISVSAYGSFLCVCKVVFEDGYEMLIDRYIDFENGRLYHKLNTSGQ